MADCYIKFKLKNSNNNFPIVHASYCTIQSNGSASNSNSSQTTTGTITIPSSLTITEAKLVGGVTRSLNSSVSWNSSYNIKINNTDVASSAGGWGSSAVNSTISTIPSSGSSVTYEIFTSMSGSTKGTSGQFYGEIDTSVYLQLKVTIPTTETLITAEKLNAFAVIFGTSTVSAGDLIVHTPWQAIGTAVGTMKTSSGGAVTAVTFDNTEPLATNLSSVITNMTNNYFER